MRKFIFQRIEKKGASNPKTGMTLIELLVATALVGIVMVGTMSVDFAIHNMRKTTADGAMVAMQTSAMMIQITSDVSKAVGDATDVGIIDCTKSNVSYPACSNFVNPTFCVRQDNNDPDVYTDDNWVCYWKPINTNDPNLYTCPRTPAQGPLPCTTSDRVVGTVGCTANCANSDFTFDLRNNAPLNQFYFNITLKNRAYPTRPYDPFKNPQYELSSRIAPIGHSY